MFIVVAVSVGLATAAPLAAPQDTMAGGVVYEVTGTQCKGYFDPKSPLTPDTEPYRGESVTKTIDANGQVVQSRIMRFPPGLPLDTMPKGFRISAKGEVDVSPSGEVVRVQLTSPDDARFAVYAASQIAYWRYVAVPMGKVCRKIPIEFEWRID